MIGYCVRCSQKREMKGVKEVSTTNGRRRAIGQCVKCGSNMSVFLPSKK